MLSSSALSTRAEQKAHYDAVRRRIESGRPKLAALPPRAIQVVESRFFEALERQDPPPQHDAHCIEFRVFRRLRRANSLQRILLATAHHFGLDPEALTGHRRTHDIVRPRQIAFWIAKQTTSWSLPEIGRRFGGKDHTTVLSGARKIERLRVERPEIEASIQAILTYMQVLQ